MGVVCCERINGAVDGRMKKSLVVRIKGRVVIILVVKWQIIFLGGWFIGGRLVVIICGLMVVLILTLIVIIDILLVEIMSIVFHNIIVLFVESLVVGEGDLRLVYSGQVARVTGEVVTSG